MAQRNPCLFANVSLRQCSPAKCRRAEQQPQPQPAAAAATAASSAAADQAAGTLLQAAALRVV